MKYVLHCGTTGKYVVSNGIMVNNAIFAHKFNSARAARLYINDSLSSEKKISVVGLNEEPFGQMTDKLLRRIICTSSDER